jgi:hypothetical protein
MLSLHVPTTATQEQEPEDEFGFPKLGAFLTFPSSSSESQGKYLKMDHDRFLSQLYSHVICVTIDGVWIGERIYLPLSQTRNYAQL